MSEKEELEQSIIDQCLEYGSIMDHLRANSFDAQSFDKLYNTIDQYRQLLGNDPMINREIAGYLWIFGEYLAMTVGYLSGRGKLIGDLEEMGYAHEKVINLLTDVFNMDQDRFREKPST